jgi:hypothetical protein
VIADAEGERAICLAHSRFIALLTPPAEVEQHLQQVGVVDCAVAVHIHPAENLPHAAECEQHPQQVGVVDAAVAVHIAVGDKTRREPEATCKAERAPCERMTGVGLPDSATQIEGTARGEGDAATVDGPPAQVIAAA